MNKKSKYADHINKAIAGHKVIEVYKKWYICTQGQNGSTKIFAVTPIGGKMSFNSIEDAKHYIDSTMCKYYK